MVQEGPEWARLRTELRGAREANQLTLDAVAGELTSRGNLSKMESGSRRLTRPIVERYALLTGIETFVRAFDYLVDKDAHPEAPPEQLPPLGAVLVSAEVEQTVTVGDVVTVIERRSVVPKIHNVEGTSIGMHFDAVDGRRPRVQPVEAAGATIAAQGWMDRSNYLVALRFPKDAIVVGKAPYEFTLTYRYELPVPVLGLKAAEPMPLYRMALTLPPYATDVFELNGVLPEALDEFVASVERGQPSMRARPFDASAVFRRDFLNLRPAHFYGVAWFPKGRGSQAASPRTP